MRTWTNPIYALLLCVFLAGCSNSLYREEFNWTAPFEAYVRYSIALMHPFDRTKPPADHEALVAALEGALTQQGLTPASRDEARAQQAVFVLNYDIAAGRRRVQTIAANEVRTWAYELGRTSADPNLVALEIYERQSGSLLYRAEALRGDTAEETMSRLLSGYPPNTRPYRTRRTPGP